MTFSKIVDIWSKERTKSSLTESEKTSAGPSPQEMHGSDDEISQKTRHELALRVNTNQHLIDGIGDRVATY